MSITAKNEKKEGFDPIPEGSYPARLYQIVHIGSIPGYQDQIQNKARLTFELPTVQREFKEGEGEKPMVISSEYTLSTHEKANLRGIVEGLIGASLEDKEAENFDIESVIAKTCLLTVKHKERKIGEGKYAVIGSVTSLPDGMDVPDQINESKIQSYDDFDKDFHESLPDFLKEKVESSIEYDAMQSKLKGDEAKTGDIPF